MLEKLLLQCRVKVLQILLACKELIADAKDECSNLVFKDICLDILAKSRLILTNDEFEELKLFVEEQLLKKKVSTDLGRKIRID